MRLVVDANVLLPAVIGGRAKAVLERRSVAEVFTAEAALAEVQEYAAQLAVGRRLSMDVVLMAVASLPVTVAGREAYERSIPDAEQRIGGRDPDDVEVLAAGASRWRRSLVQRQRF